MPTIEIAGKQIETTEMGYLVNAEDWSEDLAKAIAEAEKIAPPPLAAVRCRIQAGGKVIDFISGL